MISCKEWIRSLILRGRRRQYLLFSIFCLIVLNNYYSNVTAGIENPRPEKEFFNNNTLGINHSSPAVKSNTSSYPLSSLNLTSAEEFYRRGFWQRMEPVPLDRWTLVSNTTCIAQRGKEELEEWNYRVPYVILIGAQKGGTTALAYYLYNHPNIQYLPIKELHYFDEHLDQNNNILSKSGIPSQTTLQHYQQDAIGTIVPVENFQFDSSKRVLDATPNYLFASDRVPYRIFCATPWVKLLTLLRNPVDRAFSHYYMLFNRDLANPSNRRGPIALSFEHYVELDMRVLKETGVIREWSSTEEFDAFSGSDEEFQAWQTYTKLGLNSPIGHGLYALQLRHWLQAMDLFGKPRKDLLVLQSEVMMRHSNATYFQVLDFLRLKPHHMLKYAKIHTTQYRTPEMNPETRAKLQTFYEPYNRQLESLLGSNWSGVWE